MCWLLHEQNTQLPTHGSCQRSVENTYEHTWCLRTRDKFAVLYECPQEVSRDFNITLDTSGRNTINWCQPYWYRLITSSQKAKYHFNVPNQSSYNLCRTNTTSSWRRFIQVTCHGCELHCVLAVWTTYRTQERELPKHFLSKILLVGLICVRRQTSATKDENRRRKLACRIRCDTPRVI